GDLDQVALAKLAFLHVRVVFPRARDGLAHHRFAHAPLDAHHQRLLHLVAGDPTEKRALITLGLLVHLAALSFMTVRTRAMSRLPFFSWLVLDSCWVASCMRRPNCALSRPSSSFCSSSPFLPRSSLGFIVRASSAPRWS